MRIERHVVARRKQHLVALPAQVRHHLSLVAGAAVFWHVVRKGEATLTVSGRTRAGRPRDDADCPACAKYRDEIERLRAQLRASSVPTYNEAVRDGWAQAMRHYTRLDGDVQAVHVEVRALRAEIASGVRVRARRPSIPSPSASPPSPVASEGEAVTPGPSVPGDPQEHHEADQVPRL